MMEKTRPRNEYCNTASKSKSKKHNQKTDTELQCLNLNVKMDMQGAWKKIKSGNGNQQSLAFNTFLKLKSILTHRQKLFMTTTFDKVNVNCALILMVSLHSSISLSSRYQYSMNRIITAPSLTNRAYNPKCLTICFA